MIKPVTIPSAMRAVWLEELGPPENLKVATVPVPETGPDDVLIKTELAGLIYGDTEARRGTYYVKPKLPWIPGREVGGIIVRVGKNVTRLKPGDRVMALVLQGGCCAEYVLVSVQKPLVLDGPPLGPIGEVIGLPANVSVAQGLVYLVNFRFAHLLFHAYAKVPSRARVLVHGAAGGMGSMIIQLARAQDCEIIALCRSEAEIAFCRGIGANQCVDSTQQDYVEAVLALTGKKGVNFSFNGVGGATLDRDPLALAPFGELLVYGYVAGKATFNPYAVDRSITLKTFSADNFFPTGQFAEATEAMLAWFATGPLIGVSKLFAFEEAPAAHRWLEEGRTLGKVALRP